MAALPETQQELVADMSQEQATIQRKLREREEAMWFEKVAMQHRAHVGERTAVVRPANIVQKLQEEPQDICWRKTVSTRGAEMESHIVQSAHAEAHAAAKVVLRSRAVQRTRLPSPWSSAGGAK